MNDPRKAEEIARKIADISRQLQSRESNIQRLERDKGRDAKVS